MKTFILLLSLVLAGSGHQEQMRQERAKP